MITIIFENSKLNRESINNCIGNKSSIYTSYGQGWYEWQDFKTLIYKLFHSLNWKHWGYELYINQNLKVTDFRFTHGLLNNFPLACHVRKFSQKLCRNIFQLQTSLSRPPRHYSTCTSVALHRPDIHKYSWAHNGIRMQILHATGHQICRAI